MTSNVIATLNKIKDLEIFKDEFYFVGGTALSYFTINEILDIAKEVKNITSKEELINFISNKQESKNDEVVYLDELNRLDLSFEDIKQQVLNNFRY